MTVHNWDKLDRIGSTPLALTIGVFDGIHLGHRQLIRRICGSSGLISAVCTFTRNPGAVLNKSDYLGSILTGRQKKMRLEHLGVEILLLIDFSHEFSKLSGKQFFQKLRRYLNIRKLVVGYNFYFGRNRDTGPEQLKRILEGTDINLEVIPPTLYRNQIVSSSRIRAAISQGHIAQVYDMLTTEFVLDLVNAVADRVEKRLCFPRSQIEQVIPRSGFYPVTVKSGLEETEDVLEMNNEHLCLHSGLEPVETVCFRK